VDDPKFWVALVALVVAVAVGAYQAFSIRGQTYQRIYEQMLSIDRFFFDRPAYKAYFYASSGEAIIPEDPIHADKLNSVAEMMADYFDMVYHQRSVIPRGTYSGFEDFMRAVYHHQGPGQKYILRDYIESRKHWYPSRFLDSLRQEPKCEP